MGTPHCHPIRVETYSAARRRVSVLSLFAPTLPGNRPRPLAYRDPAVNRAPPRPAQGSAHAQSANPGVTSTGPSLLGGWPIHLSASRPIFNHTRINHTILFTWANFLNVTVTSSRTRVWRTVFGHTSAVATGHICVKGPSARLSLSVIYDNYDRSSSEKGCIS